MDLAALNYEPLPTEKLYHYCPSKSFWAILESRTLWLSSIQSLNDSTELRWGRQLATEALSENNNEFPSDFRFAVHTMFAETDKNVLPLVFSLSRNGDLLSQWRAYASDGEGFAIEFDATQLSTVLPINMKEVLYRKVEQELLVRGSLQSFASWWRKGDRASTQAVLDVLPEFAMDLLSLKHPSFFEEQEVPGVQVNRRNLLGETAPYIALSIDAPALLTGVALGPKNASPKVEVEKKLAAVGLAGLSVTRSASPYR